MIGGDQLGEEPRGFRDYVGSEPATDGGKGMQIFLDVEADVAEYRSD
jgi:hypothetical protein